MVGLFGSRQDLKLEDLFSLAGGDGMNGDCADQKRRSMSLLLLVYV